MYYAPFHANDGADVLLNTNSPTKIRSMPMDKSATASTVTIMLAETVGNPNDNTSEDNISDTNPEPICTARNHLGVSYLSNIRRPNVLGYLYSRIYSQSRQ